jgi:hypothetical protein
MAHSLSSMSLDQPGPAVPRGEGQAGTSGRTQLGGRGSAPLQSAAPISRGPGAMGRNRHSELQDVSEQRPTGRARRSHEPEPFPQQGSRLIRSPRDREGDGSMREESPQQKVTMDQEVRMRARLAQQRSDRASARQRRREQQRRGGSDEGDEGDLRHQLESPYGAKPRSRSRPGARAAPQRRGQRDDRDREQRGASV